MSLTDQQLRQELIKYGQTVPPITQRNRDQLRVLLQELRLRPRASPKSSPSRPRGNVSSARSRPSRRLIELSDSETDTSATENISTRHAGLTETYHQSRSIAVRRDSDRVNPITIPSVSVDVEESSEYFSRMTCSSIGNFDFKWNLTDKNIRFSLSCLVARHRREIQQLIDSARDRARATNANLAKQYELSPRTPIRPTSAAAASRQLPSSSTKTDSKKSKEPSWFSRTQRSVQSFWRNNKDTIWNILKALLVGLLIAGGLILVKNKLEDLIPQQTGKIKISYFYFIIFLHL